MSDIRNYVKQPHPLKKMFDGGVLCSPAIMFEAGGCEGEDTIRYMKMFPNAKLFVFEPLKKKVELINQHIEQFSSEIKKNNALITCAALSDTPGKAIFHVSKGNPASAPQDWDCGNKSSSLLEPAEHKELFKWCNFDEEEVDCIRLDDFCKEHGVSRIDFFHLDVQGAELRVLESAGDVDIRAVWLETSDCEVYAGQPRKKDIEEFFSKRDYVLLYSEKTGAYEDQLWVRNIHV